MDPQYKETHNIKPHKNVKFHIFNNSYQVNIVCKLFSIGNHSFTVITCSILWNEQKVQTCYNAVKIKYCSIKNTKCVKNAEFYFLMCIRWEI